MTNSKHYRIIGFCLVLLIGVILIGQVRSPGNPVPAQYIGKIYTEALGRAPDQGGWDYFTSWFSVMGCNARTAKQFALIVYTSQEYLSIYQDNAARVLTLYRGVFSREPDQRGFDWYYNQLQYGTSWESVLNQVLDSSEFNGLIPVICQPGPYFWGRGIGTGYPISIPITSPPYPQSNFFAGTDFSVSALQLQIDNFSIQGGGTFYLPQKALFKADKKLTIPGNVHLTTYTPNGTQLEKNGYALMARIVRQKRYEGSEALAIGQAPSEPVVEIKGEISSVWIDGGRSFFGYQTDEKSTHEPTIYVSNDGGGPGPTKIHNCRLTDALGTTNILVGINYFCSRQDQIQIENNLITGYAGRKAPGTTDGISTMCPDVLIDSNEIVDITDVGIVLFRAGNGVQGINQRSKVTANKIIQVGNSAWAAIAVEPMYRDNPSVPPRIFDFSGSEITNNLIWTDTSGPASIESWPASQMGMERVSPHFSIVLAVGTEAWWGSRVDLADRVTFFINHSGSLGVNYTIGISVNGVNEVSLVDGNYLPGPAGQFLDNGCQDYSSYGTVVGSEVINKSEVQSGMYTESDVLWENTIYGCLLWNSYSD